MSNVETRMTKEDRSPNTEMVMGADELFKRSQVFAAVLTLVFVRWGLLLTARTVESDVTERDALTL